MLKCSLSDPTQKTAEGVRHSRPSSKEKRNPQTAVHLVELPSESQILHIILNVLACLVILEFASYDQSKDGSTSHYMEQDVRALPVTLQDQPDP